MKLSKAFTCVLPGEIYPVELAAGEECPPEYEDSARAQGCLGDSKPAKGGKAQAPAPAAADDDVPGAGPNEIGAVEQPSNVEPKA